MVHSKRPINVNAPYVLNLWHVWWTSRSWKSGIYFAEKMAWAFGSIWSYKVVNTVIRICWKKGTMIRLLQPSSCTENYWVYILQFLIYNNLLHLHILNSSSITMYSIFPEDAIAQRYWRSILHSPKKWLYVVFWANNTILMLKQIMLYLC